MYNDWTEILSCISDEIMFMNHYNDDGSNNSDNNINNNNNNNFPYDSDFNNHAFSVT
jgi:hypothetical protein